MTMTLLKSCKPGSDGVAVEVEGDGAVQIGAVDLDSGVLQACENVGVEKTEISSKATRDEGGEARLHRDQNFRWWTWRCRGVPALGAARADGRDRPCRHLTALSASPSNLRASFGVEKAHPLRLRPDSIPSSSQSPTTLIPSAGAKKALPDLVFPSLFMTVSALTARRSPGGRSGQTGRPSAPPRCDSLPPAAEPGRGPGSRDRTTRRSGEAR